MTWLFYYLTKDIHPEPKKMIVKIFLWGALITVPVFFVQIGLTNLLDMFAMNSIVKNIVYWFLVIAFSEEFFKYLVVRAKVFNSPHLDEPLDIMLYMVISALGFAAIENILYLFSPIGQMSLGQVIDRTLLVDLIRFIGAVFLHTLCSAIVGYSLAISFYKAKNKKLIFGIGILVATVLHGFYDFSIMTLTGQSNINIVIPLIIILILSFLVFSGFEKLKKMKSICKIN